MIESQQITDDISEQGVEVISGICVKNKTSNRAKILECEEKYKDLPQVDIPPIHHIHGGMYGREITIPKGTILTGQIYKFDHFDIMVSGDITVSTDTGETKRLTGFNLFKGMHGKKRAGYAHEDTRWITFHPFHSADMDGEKIQTAITAKDFEELATFHADIARGDYHNFVIESGMTQEQITEQVENELDMDHSQIDEVYVGDSKIQGKGLFSYLSFRVGDKICDARIEGVRTIGGRYANHALFPNAKVEIKNKNAYLVAVRDIDEAEEITLNYRSVINTRFTKGDLSCQG